ncbi:SDR family NAD(P)-dependent oxidoreductase [Bradyrhizobium sp. RDM4]|uniref:SDR family NAD(P)-dependent oxidoreductase n=1 Tax=Bradyrhizobium sp. RDM4 TaxID=3378765 RepID=UPI0038FCB17A
MKEAGILAGKIAIVFGAGSVRAGATSNGQAAAITYARAGAVVVAVDIEPDASAETVAHITAEGGDALALAADVANETAVEQAVATTVARFGAIDVLHNNVGLLTFGSTITTEVATWDRIMEVNVRGMFFSTRAALPHMVARGGGSIINVSALASVRYLGRAITMQPQGSGKRLYPGSGDRACARRHPLQRDLARLYRHPGRTRRLRAAGSR